MRDEGRGGGKGGSEKVYDDVNKIDIGVNFIKLVY